MGVVVFWRAWQVVESGKEVQLLRGNCFFECDTQPTS
jgi:hypothetical protein